MKNIKSFCDILILLSIATLLKVADTDAYFTSDYHRQRPSPNRIPWGDAKLRKNTTPKIVNEGYGANGMMAFPDEDYIPKPQVETLKYYTSEWVTPPKPDNRAVSTLAKTLSNFHKKLTSIILASNPGQNFIYSPLSVSTLLSIMAIGARHNTANELFSSLNIDRSLTTIRGFSELTNILKDPYFTLNFVNQIFASSDVQFDDLFKNVTENYFFTKMRNVNFGNANNAAEEINKWCKEETNNHIQQIVQPDDLRDVVMVLANAIYFEGLWALPFEPEMTQTGNFNINKTKTVPVQMMSQTDDFNYGLIEELDARFIELPYQHKNCTDDGLSMFLLIPRQVNGLNLIEKKLHLVDFNRLNGDTDKARITMPKFKIEQTVDLKPVLQKMGIRSIFTRGADFFGITRSTNVYVSKMTQKAVLEVDEVGSRAAAVTAAEFANRMSPAYIDADRPFLCAIVVKSLGIPLFFARVADPTQFL